MFKPGSGSAYLKVELLLPDGRPGFVASREIPHYTRECMRPFDFVSDPMFLLTGSHAVMNTTVQREVIRMGREELAQRIARAVTDELMRYMESNDTENGYPK